MNGPCAPWPIDQWCCPPPAVPEIANMAQEAATEILWALSGRQFGLCSVWLRPCKAGCFTGPYYGWGWQNDNDDWVRPALLDGVWTNVVCGSCNGDCGCTHTEAITLPGLIHDVIDVVVDGVSVSGGYRLDQHRTLVRTDGGTWPLCQDWNVDSGEGTLFVLAQHGREVPSAGLMAVAELASEFVLAHCGSDECRLPQRVVSVDRNGLAIALDDVQSLLREGQLGLTLCDMFIAAFNPHRRASRSRVYSPDFARPRYQGGAPPGYSP